MKLTIALCLLSLLAGCSQGSVPSDAELQQRLTAAEARTKAAEARIRDADEHSAWQGHGAADGAPNEVANSANEPGAPMIDTAPVAPPQATGANLPPARLPPGGLVN